MAVNLVDPTIPEPVASGAPERVVTGTEGPDSELAARLRMAVTRLSRRLRQQADVGITPTQLSALASVERLEPVTLGELAGREQVQPPSMTRVVAVLEEAGLVVRQVDERDRRVARVTTTADGRRALLRSRTRKNAFLARRIKNMSAQDRDTLVAAIGLLESMLNGEAR
ncbi:MAG: MarR family winged helix-turn-helix transcriptional regulator [Acidimicrobiales bacterium]